MWKDINGYDGYQVSDEGLVRTHNKTSSNAQHNVRHWKDRVLRQKTRNDGKRGGDARVDLWKNGEPKGFKVSRLVAFTFFDQDINDTSLTVNHIDGDWTNNKLTNLEIVPLRDNIKHGFEHGLYKAICKETIIKNLETQEVKVFRSMADASDFIGHGHGYISGCIKQGKSHNDMFEWEVI